MRVVEETIKVKGAPDQIVRLRFTRHGPVLHAEDTKSRAFAVRSVWFEPGAAPFLGSLSTMRARDLDQFRAGNSCWGAPSMNHLFADRAGTIAWMPGGKIPRCLGWNGLLPVPGDNAPGQSGDPRSKHYDRLAPVWAASDYVPMRYTRAAVDSATEFIWRLRPA